MIHIKRNALWLRRTFLLTWIKSGYTAETYTAMHRDEGRRTSSVKEEFSMFKHILFPTDGAATSKHIIRDCVNFAKDAGAVITALHVMPAYSRRYDGGTGGESKEQFESECVSAAEEFLEDIATAAQAAGVPCTPLHVTSDYPYDAIIRAAEDRDCDLIAMASHGRKGVKGMILGSETQKVLTHTTLPVLVFRT